MTRYLFIFLLLGVGLQTSAQKIHLPIQVNHQWTFLEVTDKTTHLDTSRLYDHLGDINLPWFGQSGTQSGYYQVAKNGGLGLVTASFMPVISPSWQEIHPISEQYFLVAKAGAYTIIDRNEKPLLQGEAYQAIKLKADNSLSFFMLKQDGKWGVKKSGQKDWSIKPEYFALEFVDVGTNGLFKVKADRTAGDQWQLINWEGAPLPTLTDAFDRIEVVGPSHFAVQQSSRKTKWSVRDLSGKEVLILDPETNIQPLTKDLFSYKEKGSNTYSVLVMRNKISPLAEQFHELQRINADLVFYRMGKKSGFIQSNGSLTEIATENPLEILAGQGNLLRTKFEVEGETNKKWGLFSIKDNSLLADCQYDSIAPFTGHLTRMWSDGQMGLINDAGQLIVPPHFEAIPYLEAGVDQIYCYWKDSVEVYSVDEDGNVVGSPNTEKSTAVLGTERYYWPNYESQQEPSKPVAATNAAKPIAVEKEDLWEEVKLENQGDTLWIEADKSYWQLMSDNSYQLMQQEEVEVIIREKSTSAKKKKKSKKGKKPAPPAPKKTKLVMKWVKKGAPINSLRKASHVDWTLAYHDNEGLVSNELTNQGNTQYSTRKISIFLNETNTFLPDFEMTGIRLSDFADGLTYAAFLDLDGKIGLIDKGGKQAMDAAGTPLRFTYVGKAAEGKLSVCHPTSAFSQLGMNVAQLLQDFNARVVKGSGRYTSPLKSSKEPLWGYLDLEGQLSIPFEYEFAAPFQDDFAINRQNGKWGVINGEQETVVPFEYDAITLENDKWKVVQGGDELQEIYYDDQGWQFAQAEHASMAMQGHRLFPAQNGESPAKYGYTNKAGAIVIPHEYDEVSPFSDGLATVRQGRKWFFIDETGKEVITIAPDIIGIIEVGSFSEGLCPVRKTTILNKKPTRKYGYINTEGKFAIPPQFDGVGAFQGGVAVVDSLNLSGYKPGQKNGIPRDRALIDQNGKRLTDFSFSSISSFNEAGFAEVNDSKTGKQAVIGKDGQLLTNNYYTRVKSFKDGMAGLEGTTWRIFDYTGKEIPLPVSNIASISHFANQNLIVRDKSDQWYHLLVAADSTALKQGGFESLLAFEQGYAFARMDKQIMLYGQDESWVEPDKGQFFKFWSNGLLGVKEDAQESYMNLGGQNVFARNFDAINKFTGECAIVSYEGKSGVINSRGLFVVSPKFESISQETDGAIKVQLSGQRFGLRALDGRELVPAQYDNIEYLRNGLIRVESGDFVGYYRGDGEALWGEGFSGLRLE